MARLATKQQLYFHPSECQTCWLQTCHLSGLLTQLLHQLGHTHTPSFLPVQCHVSIVSPHQGGEGVPDTVVEGLKGELKEAQSGLQRRDDVISKLTSDNIRLVQQLEQLWQKVHLPHGTLSPLQSTEQSFT